MVSPDPSSQLTLSVYGVNPRCIISYTRTRTTHAVDAVDAYEHLLLFNATRTPTGTPGSAAQHLSAGAESTGIFAAARPSRRFSV